MLAQAGELPIRIASKSVRSLPVLRRILDLDPRFRGVLAFTLPEALWLAGQGLDDIVVAYPSADRDAISELVALAAEGDRRVPVPMVDDGAAPGPDRGGDGPGPHRGGGVHGRRRRLVAARRAGSPRSARSARRSTTPSAPAASPPRSPRGPARAWPG